MDQYGHRLDVEQFRQREAVLAVSAPVELTVTTDVDVDLIGAVGKPWGGSACERVLSSVAVVTQ